MLYLNPGPQLYLGGLSYQSTTFGRNGISMARRAVNHLKLSPLSESGGLPMTRISRGFKSMSSSGLGLASRTHPITAPCFLGFRRRPFRRTYHSHIVRIFLSVQQTTGSADSSWRQVTAVRFLLRRALQIPALRFDHTHALGSMRTRDFRCGSVKFYV